MNSQTVKHPDAGVAPLGVLLVNLGTPDSPSVADVRRYLREFLWDPRVVEVARPVWWLVLNLVILTTRPRRSAKAYAKVWTAAGSPLLVISRKQQAALQASLDERLYEGALLRALGASRRQLRAGHLAEFIALGLLAGLVAAIGTECLAWVLYSQVLHFDYSFKWQVWLAAPLLGAVLIGAAGYHGTRAVVRRSPVLLLRER